MSRPDKITFGIPVAAVLALGAVSNAVEVGYFHKEGQAKRVAAKVQINTFECVLGQYKKDTGSFPSEDQGLDALRNDPGVKGWKGPYLSQDVPNDPWNRPYLYSYPGRHGQEPDIISLGADGQPGGEGAAADIVSWRVN